MLASAAVSMHASEDGPENQDCEPVSALLDETHRVELDLIPWETRCAEDLGAAATGPPRIEVWMRTPPVDVALAPALTAYATDLTLIGTALRPFEGFSHRGNGTQFTSAVTSSHRVVSPAPPDLLAALRLRSPDRGRRAGRVLCARGATAISRRQ